MCEGARLAFGAPSAWWRLGWERIVLVPTRLSDAERNRVLDIAAMTSVEVGDVWTDESTHLVTDQCTSSSIKFLTVVAEGKHVVTTAWVEALRHTVVESCRAITDAANAEVAMAAGTLADAKRFVPPFSPADQEAFSTEELNAVFDGPVMERRKAMFKGIVFAFSREERRSRWVPVIEALGGSTTLAKVVNQTVKADRIVFVQGEQGASKKSHEALDTSGRAYVQESTLSAAIIRADVSALDVVSSPSVDVAPSPVKPTAAEVTDVATPGPLDSESEADTDDSEPSGSLKRQATAQAAPMDVVESVIDVEGVAAVAKPLSRASARASTTGKLPSASEVKETSAKDPSRTTGLPTTTKKRARPACSISPQEAGSPVAKRAAISTCEETVDGVERVQTTPAAVAQPADNSDVNERSFFKVDDIPSGSTAATGKRGMKEKTVSRLDVRPFRRRKLPDSSVIPLKRVRCVDNGEGGFERVRPQAEARGRGYGSDGARVIDSEEE